jgi:hypothetical protein
MSETPDLVRHLFDHITQTANLTDDDWQRFMRDHPMTPEQTGAVLVQTVQGLCRLATDLQQETNRLSIARARARLSD